MRTTSCIVALTCLFVTVQSANLAFAESAADADPDTLLHEALTRTHPPDILKVRSALSKGANPNRITPRKCSRLFAAVVCCSSLSDRDNSQKTCLQILRALFDAGATVQPADSDRGILAIPIMDGCDDVVTLLLSKGVDANGKDDEQGLSWVEVAEAHGKARIVEILKGHGGRPIPSTAAVQLRYLQALSDNAFVAMERSLRDGARANEGYKSREVPLCVLLRYPWFNCQTYAILLFLLKNGLNPNESAKGLGQGFSGTVLHTVMYSSSYLSDPKLAEVSSADEKKVFARLVIEALLEAGAHVAARDADGKTPLHIAAKWDNLLGAEMLLKAGATVMPRDDGGKTPLDYAESAEMIKLLKSHGAEEQ